MRQNFLTGFLVQGITAWLIQMRATGKLEEKYGVPKKTWDGKPHPLIPQMSKLKTSYERAAYLKKTNKRLYGEALRFTQRYQEWELFMEE